MNGPPLRVLRVIGRYAPAWQYGGSIRYSFDLDTTLQRDGIAVTVYTTDQVTGTRRADRRHETLGGVDIRRFATPSNFVAGRAPWLGLYPRGMRQALFDAAPAFEAIHITEARAPHVRWAFAAAAHAGIPTVWSPLGALADGVGLRRYYRALYDVAQDTRRLARRASIMIAQSPHEAALFTRHGAEPSRVRTIPLGIDANLFQRLPARGALRSALGLGDSDPLILFVGRFHPTKGLPVLVRAAAIAKREFPGLQLALLGWDDGAGATIQRVSRTLGIADAVRILPPAFDASRLQAYVDADIYAASLTTYEETSLAAMEALACGTPCVLTRQCEIPGLEAAGGGRIVDCDPAAVAAALTATLSDPDRVARAASARHWILATHTITRAATSHAEIFREIASTHSRSAPMSDHVRRTASCR